MDILKQICTREQSIKLKQLGVHQGSFFAYITEGQLLSKHSPNLELMAIATDFTAAYTVSELGEMLPPGYDSMKITGNNPEEFYWLAYDLDGKECPPNHGYKTEAEARSALLIHLLESNLITIEETNKRLQQ